MRTLIPTCESAVSTVPEWHRADLQGSEEIITSSEGWSPGALNLAQAISIKLRSPLLHAEMTRLLIDLSRHPDDESRWSRFSMKLTEDQRRRLDERQKASFLSSLRSRIGDALKRGDEVVHLSIDTSPAIEPAWLAFNYDSSRISECDWSRQWSDALRARRPDAVIREESSPTRSLAGMLRKEFPERFSSVRLTVAQALFLEGRPIRWDFFKKDLIDTLPR